MGNSYYFYSPVILILNAHMFKKLVIVSLIACGRLLNTNRTEGQQRQPACLKCQPVYNAFAINVCTVVSATKLYNCLIVYTAASTILKSWITKNPIIFGSRRSTRMGYLNQQRSLRLNKLYLSGNTRS